MPFELEVDILFFRETKKRNYEQLRRIFPIGNVEVDIPEDADIALACIRMNSYPLTSYGAHDLSTS